MTFEPNAAIQILKRGADEKAIMPTESEATAI